MNVEKTNTNIADSEKTAEKRIDYKPPYLANPYIVSSPPRYGVNEMGLEVTGSKQAMLELLTSALGDDYEYSGTIKLTKMRR